MGVFLVGFCQKAGAAQNANPSNTRYLTGSMQIQFKFNIVLGHCDLKWQRPTGCTTRPSGLGHFR